jgi:hypothetical protein
MENDDGLEVTCFSQLQIDNTWFLSWSNKPTISKLEIY